ncbi:MAG: SHOCT-like domain-containing protein [Dehalococcoidia bacterium]
MSESKKRILEMLAQKKISTDEAYRLLDALETGERGQESTAKASTTVKEKPKYLRVMVLPDPDNEHPENVDRVNVRVPMSLIRAGVKLTSLIPPEARDKVNGALRGKGIDFDVRNLKPEDLEELIEALEDLEVDVVGSKGEKVKVSVEY